MKTIESIHAEIMKIVKFNTTSLGEKPTHIILGSDIIDVLIKHRCCHTDDGRLLTFYGMQVIRSKDPDAIDLFYRKQKDPEWFECECKSKRFRESSNFDLICCSRCGQLYNSKTFERIELNEIPNIKTIKIL